MKHKPQIISAAVLAVLFMAIIMTDKVPAVQISQRTGETVKCATAETGWEWVAADDPACAAITDQTSADVTVVP